MLEAVMHTSDPIVTIVLLVFIFRLPTTSGWL